MRETVKRWILQPFTWERRKVEYALPLGSFQDDRLTGMLSKTISKQLKQTLCHKYRRQPTVSQIEML